MSLLESILTIILLAGPIVGNALVAILRALGKTEAADKVVKLAPFALVAAQTAKDKLVEQPKLGPAGDPTKLEEGPTVSTAAKSTPPPLLPILCLTLALTGCGAGTLGKVVEQVSATISVVDEAAFAAYEHAQRTCEHVPEPTTCVSEVRKLWRPLIEALQFIRQAWCQVKPEDCEAESVGDAVAAVTQ